MKFCLFSCILYVLVNLIRTDDSSIEFTAKMRRHSTHPKHPKHSKHPYHPRHRQHSRRDNNKLGNNQGRLEGHTPRRCQRYYNLARMKPRKGILHSENSTAHLRHNLSKQSRYFFMGGDDGNTYFVDAEEAPYMDEVINCYARTCNNQKYFLHTRRTKAPQQLFMNINTFLKSNYNRQKTTVFICHGWLGHLATGANTLLTDAFLTNDDVNVIVIDWSILARTFYTTASAGVPLVGRFMGEFIEWMVKNKLAQYNRIHLVGFSLGGHAVGAAGRTTRSKVMRVTALDPAGPGWYGHSQRVRPTDAKYVEVIHTNTHVYGFAAFEGYALGYSQPCGHADFFPNGGGFMPGCWTNICSHSKAYQYMAASIIYNNFIATKCASLNDVIHNTCRGDYNTLMGNSNLMKPGRGLFRVNTKSSYPFI